MSDVRLPLISITSPAATADSAPYPSGLVVPGYDVWPGGDVVSVAGTLYADGVYTPDSAPAKVFTPGGSGCWVAMSPGLQDQPGYVSTTPHPVRGVWGPLARFRTPTWPDIHTSRTLHLRVQWVSGALSATDAGGGQQSLSLPWYATLTTDDGSLTAELNNQNIGTPVADNVWDVAMSGVPPVTSATCLLLDTSELPAAQASTWRVLDAYTAAIATPGGLRRLRARQTLPGSDSWPLRARQRGGSTGSWPLRQRQRGI